jgi:hypothetical protein
MKKITNLGSPVVGILKVLSRRPSSIQDWSGNNGSTLSYILFLFRVVFITLLRTLRGTRGRTGRGATSRCVRIQPTFFFGLTRFAER